MFDVSLVNRDQFVQFGKDWKNGVYKKLNPKSLEYKAIWQEQLDRCYHGYSVGGLHISGFLYWYSNFGTIEILKEGATGKDEGKVPGTPLLRDIEVIIDREITYCQENKLGLFLMTGRRGGKSYIGSGLLAHNAIIHKDSGLIAAYNDDKASQLAKMCKNHINGLADTELYIPILKGSEADEEITLGYSERHKGTNKFIDKPWGGVIHKRIFSNNHQAANGLSARITVFEEIGIFENLIPSFNSTKYLWMEGTRVYGFFMAIGTGGDMDKGTLGASKMFEQPEVYGMKAFEDPEFPSKKTGFFIPAQYTLNDHKDENGNTNLETSTQALIETRQKLLDAKELNTLYDEIQHHPMKWQDVFLRSSGNVFNSMLIQRQIDKIGTSKALENAGTRGFFKRDDKNNLYFEPDNNLREADWPVKAGKRDENTGCIVIYEHPYKKDGKIPYGLYVTGIDPYAIDVSVTSVSLGSTFIYKRIANMNETRNIIVAEYTGRPGKSEDYSDNIMDLLEYFNSKALFENNRGSIKQHFQIKNKLSLLAVQPSIINKILKDSQSEQGYGYASSEPVKRHRADLIDNWINTEVSPGIYNIDFVLSLPLLKELLNYNFDDNFDRVDGFGSALLYDEELYYIRDTEKAEGDKKDHLLKEVLASIGFR